MASGSKFPEEDRPVTILAGLGLENILQVSMNRRDRSKSRSRPSTTQHMERSTSSMESSFMLDHWGSQSQTLDDSSTPDDRASSSKHQDKLTPITNWAHLSYIKNQRNNLRTELKAHQVAGAEAKQSVASLRRMAFRMAVNISVKEKQIATSARNLVRSRKNHYLDGRDAEKRIEELRRSLRIEEGRNKEILEALERASMLTLQCEYLVARGLDIAKHHCRRQLEVISAASPSTKPTLSSSITADSTCQPSRESTAAAQNTDTPKFFRMARYRLGAHP